MLTATLGSFKETEHILNERGNELDPKTIRRISYRAAERVRLVQRMGHFGFTPDDSLAGRRVVVSTDGGRLRLREKKRGPKTKKASIATTQLGVNPSSLSFMLSMNKVSNSKASPP
jgi:hypothetical protein